MAKWNYRGEQQKAAVPALGPDAYEYVKARTMLDVNIEVQARKNLFIYFNAQNVMNVPETLLRYGAATPKYARQFQLMTHGIQLTLGLNGTF